MDLEMTSLENPSVDSIIEIAAVVTDADLNVVAKSGNRAIAADMARFDAIPAEVRELHEKSGIIEEVKKATMSEAEAEREILAFLKEYVEPQSSPLCGNSVHVDRLFLRSRMPKLEQFFFYRNIDVTALKELARRWAPPVFAEAEKLKANKAHRAEDDILQSIEELKLYRNRFLKM
jgi:oligoribonuclease